VGCTDISDFEIRMLKSVDLYVLAGLLALPSPAGWAGASGAGQPWTQASLASALHLPQAAVSRAMQRLEEVALVDRKQRTVRRSAAEGLFLHGVPYLLPVRLGPPTRGVVTVHAAAPLQEALVGDRVYVWPDEEGDAVGVSLAPLHAAVPRAAREQVALHDFLALVDALRVGRVRERTLAAQALRARIAGGA
jgi:hypothetical protein